MSAFPTPNTEQQVSEINRVHNNWSIHSLGAIKYQLDF